MDREGGGAELGRGLRGAGEEVGAVDRGGRHHDEGGGGEEEEKGGGGAGEGNLGSWRVGFGFVPSLFFFYPPLSHSLHLFLSASPRLHIYPPVF